MSNPDRIILTPGEAAPAAVAALAAASVSAAAPVERKKPGPKPKVKPAAESAATQPGADDDLDAFDSDDLPPAPAPVEQFSPAQQALIAQMIAQAVQASKSSQDPATAAKLAAKANTTERLPTQAEAIAMCEDSVSRNIRPRPVMTVDGWYVHPESARVVDHGVAKLKVG